MTIRLKPLDQQVVVVLGASSGIGRASALRLAKRGARVVVGARSEAGLTSLVREITTAGGEAVHLVCDATDPAQVQRLADLAVRRYGRIDTWVNAAAVSLFASFEDTTPDEFRRVMEINYLGQVHGALAALPHLRAAGGGALVSISSVESRVALPLHAAYSAGKHAVQGAMDALRRDLIADGAPISVTTVRPGTIDTPLFPNSRNKMERAPKGPPPVYSPSVVAACVEHAAEHPVRDLLAGGSALQMLTAEALAPGLMDLLLAKVAIRAETTRKKTPGGSPGNLDGPTSDDRVKGGLHGRPSLYTWLQLHPRAHRVAVAGALLGGARVARRLLRA